MTGIPAVLLETHDLIAGVRSAIQPSERVASLFDQNGLLYSLIDDELIPNVPIVDLIL